MDLGVEDEPLMGQLLVDRTHTNSYSIISKFGMRVEDMMCVPRTHRSAASIDRTTVIKHKVARVLVERRAPVEADKTVTIQYDASVLRGLAPRRMRE